MNKTIWALFDNRIGSNNAIRGILQNLPENQFDIIEKNISYTFFARLPNLFKGASLLGLTTASKLEIKEPFPDMVIAGTRRSAPVARYIKKMSGGKTKLVQLLHPGFGSHLEDFDLIFVPEHDKDKQHSPNIVYTIGSPTRTSIKTMQEAKEKWEKVFADLPHPWTTVIVGGSVKGKPFLKENYQGFADAVLKLKQEIGGSILITDSRRTGNEARTEIMRILKDIPAYTYLWGEQKENPYMGYLACADNIFVSGDSVSMACDACATGKPVYVYCGKNWLTPKQLRFVQSLYDGGYAIAFDDKNRKGFKGGKILNVAQDLAKTVCDLLK